MDEDEVLDLLGFDDDDDDLLGAEDDLDDVLGARRRRYRGRRRSRGRSRRARYKRGLAKGSASGTPSAAAKEWPMGLTTVQFVNAGATTLNAVAEPQRLFRGRRLIIQSVPTAGAAAIPVTITQIFVGADNQLVNANPLPITAFAATAFDVKMVLSNASPGIQITVTYSIPAAPAVGETITVNTMIIGDSWGG